MTTHTDTNVKIIENARPGDVRPGDHLIRAHVWETCGVTVTDRREGIAHYRDDEGDWRTKEGMWLTHREGEDTTLTIRRTAPELPTEDEAVIVPANGHKRIQAVSGVDMYYAREAALACGYWRAAWRAVTSGRVCYSVHPEEITPGTWKVDDE